MPVVRDQPGFRSLNGKRIGIPSGFSSFQEHDLDYFIPLGNCERVLIKEAREEEEVVLGCDTEKRFEVLNENNQAIFVAQESSDFCARWWARSLRPLWLNIKGSDGNTVIFLYRPYNCQECCFPCFLQIMYMESPRGHPFGTFEQQWGLRPIVHVKNRSNQVVFIIEGPPCQCQCRCGDVEFSIYASDGVSKCGKISNRWKGVLVDGSTDADVFGIIFPPGINSELKALLLGATFLIHYMYFANPLQ